MSYKSCTIMFQISNQAGGEDEVNGLLVALEGDGEWDYKSQVIIKKDSKFKDMEYQYYKQSVMIKKPYQNSNTL